MSQITSGQTPRFFRRLAAMLYDFLLLIAVLFLATALLLPFNAGQAFTHQQVFYPVYLLIVSFIFYGWFWTHGGQTLGLRAWKLKVLTINQQPISWRLALLRFCTALISWSFFGLGFLWMLIDKDKRAWHDRLSKTAVFFDSSVQIKR
ncbi:MAG: RDD family protein [Methylococcaceae bacterium]